MPLVEPLPELLQARRCQMVAEQHAGLRSGLVFPTKSGQAHKGTPLNRVLKEACESAKVAIRFTPHDCGGRGTTSRAASLAGSWSAP